MNYSTKHLSLFIWNDSARVMDAWRSTILPNNYRSVKESTSQNFEEILKAYDEAAPDLVILDFFPTPPDKKIAIGPEVPEEFGAVIAQKIREFDNLVPIVVVTRDPQKARRIIHERFSALNILDVYGADVEKTGSCTGVMYDTESFEVAVVQRALTLQQWSLPEYVLARQCGLQLRKCWRKLSDKNSKEASFFKSLSEALMLLPQSGPVECWHTIICDVLERSVENVGLHWLAKSLSTIAAKFRESDGFYMAGSSSRVHVHHNVLVFLTGLLFLLKLRPIRDNAIRDMSKHRQGNSNSLCDAIATWSCVGLTHDVGYLWESFNSVRNRLYECMRFLAHGAEDKTIEQWHKVLIDQEKGLLPEIKSVNHAMVGSGLWMNARDFIDKETPSTPHELKYCELIAAAISRHDSKQPHVKAEGKAKVESSDWVKFLAVLSDELQDWGRDRRENVPSVTAGKTGKPYAFIVPESICYEDDIDHSLTSITFHFRVHEHAAGIQRQVGMLGKAEIEKRLNYTVKQIQDNLAATERFVVHLEASSYAWGKTSTATIHFDGT